VADTTLRIKAGEFVSVVGPTGCGKSTLLNVGAGLLEPSSGT
jgi:NitT/TauT family transport system ATP-binding protein